MDAFTDERTVERAVDRGAKALWATREQGWEQDPDALADLLTDLMHYAECYAEEWGAVIEQATRSYFAERKD